MPKVRPLGESARLKARWAAANANFDRQIGRLMGENKLSHTSLAAMIGVTRQTLCLWRKDCSNVTVAQMRTIMTIFERYGTPFDQTLGDQNESKDTAS